MEPRRMALEGCNKVWMYQVLGWLVLLAGRTGCARPRFDTSADMGLVLVPADAEVDSVVYRLRATDQDADFPLIFDVTATVTPVVRIENLPCTLYNKICQANVILTRRLTPGRLHDFAVRVRDSKGDSNSMQATISVTNATTQRNKIFPHIPAIIMVPEDTKPGKELDYVLVRSNQWSGKPVYIELWQPKELFTIRQRQTPAETRGVITLTGELDFETQSMYTLTIYATDPYTEPKKDTRNIAGLHLVVIVQDVQDVPPIFILAPPLTKINNTVQPGDVILRVHAEDGDKGVPREVTYGLVPEGNPFTPFFNISETTGEIVLARPLEELTQITHVGAPVVLSVVAEEIRRSTTEPPAQSTVVELGLLLGEPGNSPPFFDNDNYVAWMDENAEPGSAITFTDHYSTKVRDEDIGKAGVFALKLHNNNGTFEISPTVAERTANFLITVRDNTLIDYEIHKSLRFMIIAQEVGPATNLSATVPATIFLRDVNDNAPEFDAPTYEVTISENVTAGTRVVQVHATDKDTGLFGRIQYTRIIGVGSEAFVIDPDTGIITVAMKSSVLDRETTPSLRLSVEARDEDGKGLRGTVSLTVNLLDVNDNAPIFEKPSYSFTLNENMTNFTMPAIIKATDADAEEPNNEIRYEIIHGNYDDKFYLNEITGELFLREPVNKIRRTRHNPYENFATKFRKGFVNVQRTFRNMIATTTVASVASESPLTLGDKNETENATSGANDTSRIRNKRETDDVLFTLTVRAYDLGVPHMSGVTQVIVMRIPMAGARTVMFVVPGVNPDPAKIAETLAAITGGRVVVQEIRPYTISDVPNGSPTNVTSPDGQKKSMVVARVESITGETSLVDIERIRTALAANGFGVIGGDMTTGNMETQTRSNNEGTVNHNGNTNTNTNTNITNVNNEEVIIYKAENRLLFWLLIILGLLMLIALIVLIVCCICPGCPFYMAPRKRRVHSSETLITRSDARPKRHLHRKHGRFLEGTWHEKKQAWSADPTRRNWQFNRRNRRAPGLASLPGDVHIVDREQETVDKTSSLRLRDRPVPMYLTDPSRRPEDERIYIEDVEGLRGQTYGVVDVESLRQQDVERGPEMVRRIYMGDGEQRGNEPAKFVREQHFYRDGNAEVLRLVTRGQMEEAMMGHPMRRPQTLVIDQGQSGAYRIDGKEILLQRFIEDQEIRHVSDAQDLHDSFQDIERPGQEFNQRQKEPIAFQQQQQSQPQQQKILLIPERLEDEHRQHIEEVGPDVQRLIIDHGSFEKTTRFETKETQELVQGATLLVRAAMPKVMEEKPKDPTTGQSVNVQHYSIHDLELARQNALLTRLLLERDGREPGAGGLVDSASYLETQSLPGQVAIATQTDRTTATQTELPNRSRSDNDESEEEARMRKKLKSKKRHADGEPRRIRTLWMKSPIKEEDAKYSVEKRTNVARKKMKDIKDSRRVSLEPHVLREISDSLDENGDPPMTSRRRDEQDDENSKEESRNEEATKRLEESSSLEMRDVRRNVPTKRETRKVHDDGMEKRSHRDNREDTIEPSFRILEKEMTSLSKKLSKLVGRKILQSSNGSETDSQDKLKTMTTDSKKIDRQTDSQTTETKKTTKMVEISKTRRSKSTPRPTSSESTSNKEQMRSRDDDVVDRKSRQVPYKKCQTLSTGSSDVEDASEKSRKQHPQVAQLERQKQMFSKSSHGKLKRQSNVESKGSMKTDLPTQPREDPDRKGTSDSTSKASVLSGKSDKHSVEMKKQKSETVDEKKPKSGHASGPSCDNSKGSKSISEKELPVDVLQKETTETIEESNQTVGEEISKLSVVESIVSVDSVKMKKLSKETVLEERPRTGHVSSPSSEGSTRSKPRSEKELSVDVIRKKSTDTIEESSATLPEEVSKRPSVDSIKDVSVETAVTEIKRESPEVPEIATMILSTTAVMEKNVSLDKSLDKKMADESSTPTAPRPESAKNPEPIGLVESIEAETFEASKKASNDFLAREISDNERGSQVQGHSIAEGVERLRNIVLEKVAMERGDDRGEEKVIRDDVPETAESVDSRSIDATEKEKTEPIKLEDKEDVDVVQVERISEDVKLVDNVSIVEKEVISEFVETEDDGKPNAFRKEEMPGSVDVEDKEIVGSMQEGKVLETIESKNRESLDASQHEEPSAPPKSDDHGMSSSIQKGEATEVVKSETSEHQEELKDSLEDTVSDADPKVEVEKTVSHQSEDAGAFTDNFDSFCGTTSHPEDSWDAQGSVGMFPYETLQSESSEEQTTVKEVTGTKDVGQKDGTIETVDKSIEIAVDPKIGGKEDIQHASMASPEEPAQPDNGHEASTKKAVSRSPTPVSPVSELEAKKIEEKEMEETKTDDAANIPITKLDTDTEMAAIEGQPDILKHAEELVDPLKVEQTHSELAEGHIATPPLVVPPLDLKMVDEFNTGLNPKQNEFDSNILKTSPHLLPSPRPPILESSLQKEFGIADSLFIDAKLLKSPSSSRKKTDMDADREIQPPENVIDDQNRIPIDLKPISVVELSRGILLDDPDDSDSSEASSRTTLTARPYGTPRHRPISRSNNVEEPETLEDESIDQSVEVTETPTTKEALQKTPVSSEDTDVAMEKTTKVDSGSLFEGTTKIREAKSPVVPTEAGKTVSPIATVDQITLIKDVGPVNPDSASKEAAASQVVMHTHKVSEVSLQIGNPGDDKVTTSATGEVGATSDAALEKVQQLNQIPQEKLPADPDADGFDSLPETDKTVKNLGDAKLPGPEVRKVPGEAAKTGVGQRVGRSSSVGTKKPVTSLGKETKAKKIEDPKELREPKETKVAAMKRRESSKEDVPRGARKLITMKSKTESPKEEKKMASMKEEASKVGKQSVVIRQFSRDSKRGVQAPVSKLAEQTDPLSRAGQARKAFRRVDHFGQDGQDRNKSKSEEPTKTLYRSESGNTKNKRQVETPSTRTKLKDPGTKSIPKKTQKTEKPDKNVGEPETKKALEMKKVPRIDQQEIVEKSIDPEDKDEEVQQTIDSSKERTVELRSDSENAKSETPSALSQSRDEDKERGADEPPFLEVNRSPSEGTTSELGVSRSSDEKEEGPEPIVEGTRERDASLTEEATLTKDAEIVADERVTKDSTMIEQPTKDPTKDATESTIPSDYPETRKVPVIIESNTDKDAMTLDVSESPEKGPKSPPKITGETSRPKIIRDVQPKVEEESPVSSEKKVIGDVTPRIEPSTKLVVPVDVTPKKHSERADNVEAKKKSGRGEESTSIESLDKTELGESSMTDRTTSPRKVPKHRREHETMVIEGQSRYMEWYKLKREEMERKRQERKDGEEEEERPKWLRRSTRQRWFKVGPNDKKIFDPKISDGGPKKKKIKPLVNVESEQLKAIVRQGRALRKAQGDRPSEPQIEIFAREKPCTPLSCVMESSRAHHHHHLVQHSEYKYEKMPVAPFYLHSPVAPHSLPQMSSQQYDEYQSLPADSRCPKEDFDSGMVVQLQQGGSKLRNQQLLEKKSVFDIAYSEAAPSQLRADSTTPPS